MKDHPNGQILAVYQRQRKRQTADNVLATLQMIEAEIDANSGLYPKNHGRLNIAEICQRANIQPVTLRNPRHKATRDIVDAWLANLHKCGIVTSKSAARKEIQARKRRILDHNEEAMRAMAADQQKYLEEIRSLRHEISELKDRISAAHSAGNVIGIVKKTIDP